MVMMLSEARSGYGNKRHHSARSYVGCHAVGVRGVRSFLVVMAWSVKRILLTVLPAVVGILGGLESLRHHHVWLLAAASST